MTALRSFVFLLIFSVSSLVALGQQPNTANTAPPAAKDTSKLVDLIRADELRQESLNDSTTLEILIGDAQLKQGNTYFRGDSIVKNQQKNIIEVFGNIRINDADSIHISSQYLIYYGNTRMAYLKKNVKLTDGKATLTTETLEYDVNSKIGNYTNQGKIVNGASTLTSKEGYYYADTRDAYFTTNVQMVDPEYTMATDTLLYNADTEVATFVSPTTINDGRSVIYTSDGYYDMKNGQASFGKRPTIQDSTQHITADNIQFDKHTGKGFAEGNFIYRDTAQGVTVMSEKSFFNQVEKTFEASSKPVMIIKQDNDSLFIASDTLYSGIQIDSVYQKDTVINIIEKQVWIPKADSLQGDSSAAGQPRATNILQNRRTSRPVVKAPADSLSLPDKLPHEEAAIDSSRLQLVTVTDTIMEIKNGALERVDSTRFFKAYHHARVFSDSMQAVCDSLFFSASDSIFRLFTGPIVWAKESQITGDTIFLHTKDKKPQQVEVWENAFSISKSGEFYYNQLKGNAINGFFKEGDIEHIRAKGSAESLYYLQDDDSAYTGANYAQADLINLYLEKKELQKITWINEVTGVMYPVKEVPEDKRQFRNFRWEEARRPKTRLELFE
ncbi:MAG: LPS export ABC transporter periplasmic protein LptC [Chitinophagaceae bacterium]|nr:LPS export ABC transporter periplasmic protein LptC [Chitinophagaceae bacterium]MCW5927395.1 LPS export ABC transporter periplasmic protein LptC [Chitinophagaceae bacterium]